MRRQRPWFSTRMRGLPVFANAFTLAGKGQRSAKTVPFGAQAAVAVRRNVTFAGPVTLDGDTTVSVEGEDVTLTFAGGVSGTGTLTVIGTGTVKFASAVTCDVALACDGVSFAAGSSFAAGRPDVSACSRVDFAGGVLDLGGANVTLASISGSGVVTNGRVTVTGEIQPGGAGAVGTLVFAEAPVVAGATLVVDGDGLGGSDRLVVMDAFDVSGLGFVLSAKRDMRGSRFVVVEATGGVSGTLPLGDLPPRIWSFAYEVDAIALLRDRGTLILYR